MQNIKPLKQVRSSDTGTVGGKAASLGEMMEVGFAVPDGFVVTCEQVSDTDIIAAFKGLNANTVAVRSSATAEDGKDHAWAGQLESYLNVSEGELLKKIALCFASINTDRAIAYRKEKGLESEDIRVSVIVQKMVVADAAGVAFSIHPVTNDSDQILIDAVIGLGEKLVSGKTTPDTYVFSKSSKTILNRSIHNTQILTDEKILELSLSVTKIEQYFGFPCDIEWAYEKDTLYILQCRPITTTSNTGNIEEYLYQQKMISLGTRGPDIFEARLKIIGWSSNLINEFGVGYKTMLINSNGQQFGDKESRNKIDEYFSTKDIVFAKKYISKMEDLNNEIIGEIEANGHKDFTGQLSYLFTYFIAIRWAIENIYESCSIEDQKYIDNWRNNETIFSSFEMISETRKKLPDPKEWTVIKMKGNMTVLDKVISCSELPENFETLKEIKGQIGYQGIVLGKARVVLTDEERNSIQESEIIIAPMTTLDFTPFMAKAAAFVTDEGGVTCHAAIVAREMKKPCIIGTRFATKFIKTGDMIEVDAYAGIVRIIK